METEKGSKLSFFDVEIIHEQGKFTSTIYRKPTFSDVYSNFERFLPSFYKLGMVYALVYRYFSICSNWTQFHTGLAFLKEIFQKNGYPWNFIDKYFRKFLNNIHLFKENVPTVEKKCLFLVQLYLGTISLQTGTKLQQALKDVLSCCKLEIGCYYGESIRHLDIRSGEQIGVSPLIGKKVKPSNNCAIYDNLLHCNFLPSFDNSNILAQENKKNSLELKESLLIMRQTITKQEY